MKISAMESENEFEVDEPEEIQNNASDDDWTPEKSGRRQSTRLRISAKKTLADVGSSEDDESEGDSDFDAPKRKGRGGRRGRPVVKKARVSSTTNNVTQPPKPRLSMVPTQNLIQKTTATSDSEPTSTTTTPTPAPSTTTPGPVTITGQREYMSGAFVVLKADFNNPGDPPIWKIDGKALLQKYIPFVQDEKIYYKNTSVYSGWTLSNKDQYYPCSVSFKQQSKKEHIVEFLKDSVTPDDPSVEPAAANGSIKKESKERDPDEAEDEEDEDEEQDENEDEDEEEDED